MVYNKKGLIPGAIVDFIGYLSFGVVLLVFFFLFKLPLAHHTGGTVTQTDFTELHAQQFLLNYLRSTVEINGENITMADYIARAYDSKNKDVLRALENKINADLGGYIKNRIIGCYALWITESNNDFISLESDRTVTCELSVNAVSIPAHSGILKARIGIVSSGSAPLMGGGI